MKAASRLIFFFTFALFRRSFRIMSLANKKRVLSRDCAAIKIPSGDPLIFKKGAQVHVTQTLGGSYTVMSDYGLARIAGHDADALGEKPAEGASVPDETQRIPGAPVTEGMVLECLKSCYDPEIPVNIVDLGLVYGCVVEESAEGRYRVTVQMTLTAPGCGMGPAIAADARSKVMALPNVEAAEVSLVWDPPWNIEMISEEGKMRLGMI